MNEVAISEERAHKWSTLCANDHFPLVAYVILLLPLEAILFLDSYKTLERFSSTFMCIDITKMMAKPEPEPAKFMVLTWLAHKERRKEP